MITLWPLILRGAMIMPLLLRGWQKCWADEPPVGLMLQIGGTAGAVLPRMDADGCATVFFCTLVHFAAG
jgi:hypothetical protein